MTTWSITEKMRRDAEEMRAFYHSVGVSPEVTDRAIAVKLKPRTPDGRGTWRSRKKRAALAAK